LASRTVTVTVAVLAPSAAMVGGEAVMVERATLGSPGGGALTVMVPVSSPVKLPAAAAALTLPLVPAVVAVKVKLGCGPASWGGRLPPVVQITATSST